MSNFGDLFHDIGQETNPIDNPLSNPANYDAVTEIMINEIHGDLYYAWNRGRGRPNNLVPSFIARGRSLTSKIYDSMKPILRYFSLDTPSREETSVEAKKYLYDNTAIPDELIDLVNEY